MIDCGSCAVPPRRALRQYADRREPSTAEAGWPATALEAVTVQPWGWSAGENAIQAAFVGCSMCCIAPGGIPGIAIGPPFDIAAAELTAIAHAIVGTDTTSKARIRRPPRESAILSPLAEFYVQRNGIRRPALSLPGRSLRQDGRSRP